ncbi:MAG: ATP-binding protein [Lachnospiraceae bacterium]|nr:ATP-binding protein [Lachnospiraceae bacterium]
MEYTFNSVFSSATFPEYTYVNRKSSGDFTYEERLKMALEQMGYLIVIDGPSKIGKTVLCEAVIGRDKLVAMTGNDFKGENDFWTVVAKKVDIPLAGEVQNESAVSGQGEQIGTRYTSRYQTNKERVLKFFLEYKKVLLLDDFHYAEEKMQHDAACQLKEAIRSDLKAIVVSLPHRVDETVKNNPDLQGRIMNITMKPWKNTELAEIPKKGFLMLGVTAEKELIDRLVMECIDSPQTMQSICENIGYYISEDKRLKDDDITKSCYLRADYLTYQELYAKLLAGLSSRGQKRAIYYLEDGSEVDRYGLVLEALRKDPPLKAITISEIYERAKGILDKEKDMLKLTTQTIKGTLNSMFSILEESGYEADRVFDWKENVLTFREPLFLFYLRWRRDE